MKASGSGQQSKGENRGETYQLWKGRDFLQSWLLMALPSWVWHSLVDAVWNGTCHLELKNKHDVCSLISQLRRSEMQVARRLLFSFLTSFLRKKSILFVIFVLLPYSLQSTLRHLAISQSVF